VVVTDDNGTPGVPGDDFAASCPSATLAAGASMLCTATVDVSVDTTNVAVVHGVTAGGNSATDQDDADVHVLTHGLTIDKSNDAPVTPVELPEGTKNLPTAAEGATVNYTLKYTFTGDPVARRSSPTSYPSASATPTRRRGRVSSHSRATRTDPDLDCRSVTKSGSVSYSAVVLTDAAKLFQPLTNTATIRSEQTTLNSDVSDVYVPTVPGESHQPTPPPTDALAPTTPSGPGSSLALILAALGILILGLSLVTPVPAVVRRRSRR
jgi:hypothetical protein